MFIWDVHEPTFMLVGEGEGVGIKIRQACVFGGTTVHFESGIRTFQNTTFLTRGRCISGKVFGEQNRIFFMKQWDVSSQSVATIQVLFLSQNKCYLCLNLMGP